MIFNWFNELDNIYACPKCKKSFSKISSFFFICNLCNLKYPLINGIPGLLLEKAEPILSNDIDITNHDCSQ